MKITAYFEAFGNVERVQFRHINSDTRVSGEKTNVKSPQWKAAYSVIYRTYQEKPQHFYLVKFHVKLIKLFELLGTLNVIFAVVKKMRSYSSSDC